MGIDVVVESATKYLNGHADLAAGAVAGSSEFLKKARMPPSCAPGCTAHFYAMLVFKHRLTLLEPSLIM